MNSKKAITILVIATLLMAFVPVFPANADLTVLLFEDEDGLAVVDGDKGDTVVVIGEDGNVPGGSLIELFWDDATIAWNGIKGKLNATTADSDGNFEIWFKIPESKNGDHTIWIKAGTDYVSKVLPVYVKVDPDSDSGLEGDRIDVDVYGQSKEKDIGIVLVSVPWTWVAAAQEDVALDLLETEFDDTLPSAVGEFVEPGSVMVTIGVLTYTDDGDGEWSDPIFTDSSINYVTGEWELEFDTAPDVAFTIDYNEFVENEVTTFLLSSSGTTNVVGSYTKRIVVPDPIAPGAYDIETLDAKGVMGSHSFDIGSVITVNPDEADVGDRVTIKGRGFTPSGTIAYPDVTVGGIPVLIHDYDGIHEDIATDGEFSFDIYVPNVSDEDEEYTVTVTDNLAKTASADLDVEDLAEITVSPDYGPQGQTVSISGINFPNTSEDESIIVALTGGDPVALPADVIIKEFDSNSDGSFDGTFRIPAEQDGTYDIIAYWPDPEGPSAVDDTTYQADDSFRIGSVLVLLSDDEGPAGLEVILSGNGFSDGEGWNATFGGIDIFEDETVAVGGLLKQGTDSAIFYVPQLPEGMYDIVVIDEDTEIEVTTEFEITHATTLDVEPMEAPSGYNITFEGRYWSESVDEEFEWWVYNDTEEWEITDMVYWDTDEELESWPVADLDYGEFDAWWVMLVPDSPADEDDWSKGTYSMNVTYGDDWIIQYDFVVGDEHVSIAPRKSTFRIGDTVSFDIQHSFGNVLPGDDGEIYGGVIDIYDPVGDMYFETDGLTMWEKSGMYYFVPVSGQASNMNPLVLLDDAPLGDWTWEWLMNDDEGDEDLIAEGSFMVAPSNEDVVSGKIDDLNNQITNLQDSVSDVTAEFDNVRSDIADVAAIAEQAVSAANTAAEAIQTVAQTANTASQAAENAADAANAAKDAASGLTTLVYGAIGASLVAALAAIVSLMQISRRIAG